MNQVTLRVTALPRDNSTAWTKQRPTEYLRQIWFDSLVFTPEAIRHLAAQVGPGQIVLGSDYPDPWALKPVDHIFACESLSDEQKAGVLGETAAKLLKIGVRGAATPIAWPASVEPRQEEFHGRRRHHLARSALSRLA